MEGTMHRTVLWAAVFLVGMCSVAAGQNCADPVPNPPVPRIDAPSVPADVCIPAGFAGNPIAFFDDYSWRTFIAMVWPAKQGQHGVSDGSQSIDAANRTVVFETFKADWEVFQPGGTAPSTWESFEGKNPCGGSSINPGDLVLASFSKFGNLGQAGFGDLIGPLVAQNRTYVRYLTAFNEVEFKQILGQKLFWKENLNNVSFPSGALDVKSAWVDMANIPHPERYYTRTALVLDPQTGTCSKRAVGLIGLHIAQKTPSRPQWIWSSFEQVDNVPPADAGAPGAFTLNNGSGEAMPDANPYSMNPLPLPTPPAFNVTRVKPIHDSTRSTNSAYRKLLGQKNSVWQFYQLVATQWPLIPNNPSLAGTPNNTFPGVGSDQSGFANTALETFDQGKIRTGCMNCHTATKSNSDFLWSLAVNASEGPAPATLTATVKALRKRTEVSIDRDLATLKSLLQSAQPSKNPKPIKNRPKSKPE